MRRARPDFGRHSRRECATSRDGRGARFAGCNGRVRRWRRARMVRTDRAGCAAGSGCAGRAGSVAIVCGACCPVARDRHPAAVLCSMETQQHAEAGRADRAAEPWQTWPRGACWPLQRAPAGCRGAHQAGRAADRPACGRVHCAAAIVRHRTGCARHRAASSRTAADGGARHAGRGRMRRTAAPRGRPGCCAAPRRPGCGHACRTRAARMRATPLPADSHAPTSRRFPHTGDSP